MDMQKMISELAEHLRNADLERLERYQKRLAAYEIVEKLIKNEMSNRKNKELLDSFKNIQSKLDCECGGCVYAVREYQRRLKENAYESEARRRVESYYANLEKRSL